MKFTDTDSVKWGRIKDRTCLDFANKTKIEIIKEGLATFFYRSPDDPSLIITDWNIEHKLLPPSVCCYLSDRMVASMNLDDCVEGMCKVLSFSVFTDGK